MVKDNKIVIMIGYLEIIFCLVLYFVIKAVTAITH